ncbi:Major sperm protein [Aphelenchoides besseyi]|nr:Major sperm protein [Aphelenchoides besseyi]
MSEKQAAEVTAVGSSNASSPKKESSMSVDPEVGKFLATGGRSEHMCVNLGESRICVKVRCSNNVLYRVNPVYMFIDPRQCQNLIVSRLPGEPKGDKLILHYLPCDDNASDPHEVFKNSTRKPEQVKILLVCLTQDEVPTVGPSTPPAADNK